MKKKVISASALFVLTLIFLFALLMPQAAESRTAMWTPLSRPGIETLAPFAPSQTFTPNPSTNTATATI